MRPSELSGDRIGLQLFIAPTSPATVWIMAQGLLHRPDTGGDPVDRILAFLAQHVCPLVRARSSRSLGPCALGSSA